MISIFSYYATGNLGDAIQAVAMMELLEEMGVPYGFRERDSGFGDGDVVLASGYLDGRWRPALGKKHLFCGVYCQSLEIARKVAKHATGTIGCRDPWTLELMETLGAPAELVGCATLTLKRPELPRSGIAAITGTSIPGQDIPNNWDWTSQVLMARERILLLASLRIVWTPKLHIALPCLAIGTPVKFEKNWLNKVSEPQRLTLLDAIGFQYGENQVIDVSGWADRYRTFVEDALEGAGIASTKPLQAV